MNAYGRIAQVHNELKLRDLISNKLNTLDYYELEALYNKSKEYIEPILMEKKYKLIQSITTRFLYLDNEEELFFKKKKRTDEDDEKFEQIIEEKRSLLTKFKTLTKQNKLNKLTTQKTDEDDEAPPAKKQMVKKKPTDDEQEKNMQILDEKYSLLTKFITLTKQNKLNKLTTQKTDEEPPTKKQMVDV